MVDVFLIECLKNGMIIGMVYISVYKVFVEVLFCVVSECNMFIIVGKVCMD